jgi:hypothetical protein
LAAIVCLTWLTACASETPAAGPPASGPPSSGATASASPTAVSPSATTRYELPQPAVICAAMRRSGLDIVGTKPEHDGGLASRCKVDIASKGRRPRELPYTLRVKVQSYQNGGQAKYLYDSSKNTDWERGHSAFSGAAAQRAEVRQVGQARSGVQYEEGYYAYYPDHQVAGSKDSESLLTLRKGNLIITLDLLAGDLTGSTVASIKPVAADVGSKIFDMVADELIALIRSAV